MEGKSTFQTGLEAYLTDPLFVGDTQNFVRGDLNIDLMERVKI